MSDEKRIHVTSAESILLPSLALYSGVAKEDRLEALKNPNITDTGRRIGKLILGEQVLDPAPLEQETALANRYLAWAKERSSGS